VRFICSDSDSCQPLSYVANGLQETVTAFLSFVIITNAGNFFMQVQPEQVTKAMLEFFLAT